MLRYSLHQRRQQGFTLIELVIVIVIIGILAAIALPKFASLAADARAGAIKGVAGTLASTNASLLAKAQTLGVGSNGVLSNTATGCSANVQLSLGYAADLTNLLRCVTLTPSTDFGNNGTGIWHNGAATNSTCSVTYVNASGTNLSPNYTIDVSNCS